MPPLAGRRVGEIGLPRLAEEASVLPGDDVGVLLVQGGCAGVHGLDGLIRRSARLGLGEELKPTSGLARPGEETRARARRTWLLSWRMALNSGSAYTAILSARGAVVGASGSAPSDMLSIL